MCQEFNIFNMKNTAKWKELMFIFTCYQKWEVEEV